VNKTTGRGYGNRFVSIKSATERFLEKVNMTGSCWLWKAHLTDDGYGWFRWWGGTKAHRFSYEKFKGKIPDGLVIDHICRVRHCVNPAHLQLLTNKQNVLLGIGSPALNARKTHCKRGHELIGNNFEIRGRSRCCLLCRKQMGAIYRERRRNK
jgi:hypothetical protein